MKKLLLSLFMMAGVAAFAQNDIALTLNTPVAGDTIRKSAPFNINYTITNKGVPLTAVNDTIVVLFAINNTFLANGNTPIFQLYTGGLATDSSVTLQLSNAALSFNAAATVNICAIAFLTGDTINDDDNGDCAAVQLAFNTGLSAVELAANSVKVYPNPAVESVNFTIDYNQAATVKVMDITGKLVAETSFEFGSAQVDLRNLNSGVYFYQIADQNGSAIKAGKFTVSK